MTQVTALPADALDAHAEVLEVLQLTPWNGRPQHENNPEGAVRRWTFRSGQAGQVVYLVLEEQQRHTCCSCSGGADANAVGMTRLVTRTQLARRW
ncbi:MAG: hypothetical protein ACRDS0_28405 [Pseudonocardiaceae bacterium]